MFDTIFRIDGDGPREITLEQFRAIPITERCVLVVQKEVEFRRNGERVSTKRCLASIAQNARMC